MLYNLITFLFLFFICVYTFCARLDKSIYFPFLFFLLSGFLVAYFPQLLNGNTFDQSNLSAISGIAARSTLFLFILVSIPYKRSLINLFFPLAFLNSLYMIYQFVTHQSPYGIGLASSFDATILAILYPLILSETENYPSITKFISRALPIIAILITKGSIGLAGLFLSIFVIYLISYWDIILPLLPISYFAIKNFAPQYLNDSARYICWNWSMNWWWTNANHLFGTGLGTYSIIGPYIQLVTHSRLDSIYTEMHNDWLQILFETGFIGLLISLSLFAYLIYKARSNHYQLASVLVYAFSMILYYPTRNVVTAIYGVLLIKSILTPDDSNPTLFDLNDDEIIDLN